MGRFQFQLFMSSKWQMESFYLPLNIGRIQRKQPQGISPTFQSPFLCWYHQALWSLFTFFMQPDKPGCLLDRKMVELYNPAFKQEKCFRDRIESCSDSIPTPTQIPFHSLHSPFFFFHFSWLPSEGQCSGDLYWRPQRRCWQAQQHASFVFPELLWILHLLLWFYL